MYAFISIIISLAVLVTLLRLKVKIGLAMVISACLSALLLGVWPTDVGQTLIGEWQDLPLTRTTGYLFVLTTAKQHSINWGERKPACQTIYTSNQYS